MMNEMNDLMQQLAAIQAAVNQTQESVGLPPDEGARYQRELAEAPWPSAPALPPGAPPMSLNVHAAAPQMPGQWAHTPNYIGVHPQSVGAMNPGLPPEYIAQLQALAQGRPGFSQAAAPLPAPPEPEVQMPTHLEREVNKVSANVTLLTEKLDMLAAAMQSMVRHVSGALADVLTPKRTPDPVFAEASRVGVHDADTSPRLEMVDWDSERTVTRVDIPVLSAETPAVQPASRGGDPRAAEPSENISQALQNLSSPRIYPDPVPGDRLDPRKGGGGVTDQ